MECNKIKSKHVCRILLGERKALNIIKKEAYLFSCGVVYIRTNDGKTHIFSSQKLREQVFRFEFCLKKEDESVLSLADEEKYLREWKQIFVFLFDEDGAFLLYANCKCLNKVGMKKLSTGKLGLEEVWCEAINVAALISPMLFEEISNMKSDTSSLDITLLRGGEDHDW